LIAKKFKDIDKSLNEEVTNKKQATGELADMYATALQSIASKGKKRQVSVETATWN